MSELPEDDALETLLGQAADEFTESLNRGESPDIEAFARRYPQIAALVRDVLPALQIIRPPVTPSSTGPASAASLSVLGDYRILREIGRGGMGVVYEAEQISLGRRVALKVLPASPALDAKHLARFQREARTAAGLHHTNIVPVFEVGSALGVHFYAMQYIDGQSLDHVLNEMRGRLTAVAGNGQRHSSISQVQEETAQRLAGPLVEQSSRTFRSSGPSVSASHGYFLAVARMGIQVAEALDYAHKRGVIHRDIKPSNLILDHSGIVWISDFGLVKHLDEETNLTRTGDVVGTARYISPEQALVRRGPIDCRSDIYALGATLYELLTLSPAFDGADHATLLQQIALEEPTAPRQRNRAVPRDLETIVLKAMAKSPRDRYQTDGALVADLRRFVAGESIQARPLSLVERTWNWARRRPAAAALVAVSALAVLALLGVGIWSNSHLRLANERERQRALEAEERERIGRRHLYAAHLSLAQQAWERGHAARVRALLEREVPALGQEDLRGFEWHYFWQLSHRELQSWIAHRHAISSLAFSPDGKLLVTGSHDRTIKFWDPATGALQKTLSRHRGAVTAIAFSPDGQLVASASQDQTIRLWDVASGEERGTLRGHTGPVHAVAFGSDGKLLASAGEDGSVRLWQVATQKERTVLTGHAGPVWAVAFAPRGQTLASGGADHSVRCWSLEPADGPVVLKGHDKGVRAMAFAPDGKTLASGSMDQTVRLWDLATHQERAKLKGHTDVVSTVAFSPDGRTLASGDGDPSILASLVSAKSRATQLREKPGEIKLWDVPSGQERASLRGHASPVFSVAFAPHASMLASGGEDMSVILWDSAGTEQLTLTGHTGEVNSVAFAADGGMLISGGDDHTIRVRDIATGRELTVLRNHTGPVKTVAFSPDGRLFASGSGDRTVKLWDAQTRQELGTLKGHKYTLRVVAFSPDGRTLATGSGDFGKQAAPLPGEVKLWDVASRREQTLAGHTDIVRTAAYSPDGRTLATGADDKKVKLWNVDTGQEVFTVENLPYSVRSAAFSADGRTLAIACGGVWDAHEPGQIMLWDVATRQEKVLLKGHRAGVMLVVFAPDGKSLATTSTDGTIMLWDPVTGQERVVLEGHKGGIRTAAFAPDSQILATGDSNGLVKLWHAPKLAIAAPDPRSFTAGTRGTAVSPACPAARRIPQEAFHFAVLQR